MRLRDTNYYVKKKKATGKNTAQGNSLYFVITLSGVSSRKMLNH